jgi:hypothetical protein
MDASKSGVIPIKTFLSQFGSRWPLRAWSTLDIMSSLEDSIVATASMVKCWEELGFRLGLFLLGVPCSLVARRTGLVDLYCRLYSRICLVDSGRLGELFRGIPPTGRGEIV